MMARAWRDLLAIGSLWFVVAIATPAAAVELTPLVGGFSSLVDIAHTGDARLFLVEQDGLIRIWSQGVLLPTPFLDLSGLIGSGIERGFKGIAFHPDHANNGFVFVHYSAANNDSILARYTVSAADPNVADPASAAILLTLKQTTHLHRGGAPRFGADGYLYLAFGDGGPQHDAECRAQRPDTLHGKMVRLDVNQNVATAPFYGIPAGNPYGGPNQPPAEVWSIGFRNPWRIAFDRQTGDLFIADVGQSTREEVSHEPAGTAGGRNYGWQVMEGTSCHDPDPLNPRCPITTPPCFAAAFTPPVLEYDHSAGDCAITGGHVHQGSRPSTLTGRYLYGDFCTGNLWAAKQTGGSWSSALLPVQLAGVRAFGEDAAGETYLTDGTTLFLLTATELFADSFESGDANAWSARVP